MRKQLASTSSSYSSLGVVGGPYTTPSTPYGGIGQSLSESGYSGTASSATANQRKQNKLSPSKTLNLTNFLNFFPRSNRTLHHTALARPLDVPRPPLDPQQHRPQPLPLAPHLPALQLDAHVRTDGHIPFERERTVLLTDQRPLRPQAGRLRNRRCQLTEHPTAALRWG